jgi:hypothetical protein
MADVGIHRLAAGDDQHQRAQGEKRVEQTGVPQIIDAEKGIEDRKNFRMLLDLPEAENSDHDEPEHEPQATHR